MKRFLSVTGWGVLAFLVTSFNATAQELSGYNIQKKIWDFNLSTEDSQPFVLQKAYLKKFDVLDWEILNKIPNRSIDACTSIDQTSDSWYYTNNYKNPKTRIMLLSPNETSYPCQYMWNHLNRNNFGMASLEDIPLPILEKFTSPKIIFYRADIFYEWYFHGGLAKNRIKHEEMHILQYEHNPQLERYMWNEGKNKLTSFGEFIEGCTESHYPTAGFLNYSPYIKWYNEILNFAEFINKKSLVHQACLGNYDAFWDLEISMASILR